MNTYRYDNAFEASRLFPGTAWFLSTNAFSHILIHYLKKVEYESMEASRFSVYTEKNYLRIFKSLFAHTDASHILYNCLHGLMYAPILDQHLPKPAITFPLCYLATGAFGVFTFLEGTKFLISRSQPTMTEAADFVPLGGNSPSAYGLHVLTALLAPQARNSDACFYFGLISSLPPLIANWKKMNASAVTLAKRKMAAASSSSSPTSPASPQQPLEVIIPLKTKLKVVAAAATAGIAHYLGVRAAFADDGPTTSEALLVYVFFRRWSQGFFEYVLFGLGDGCSDNDGQSDDNLGHLGGMLMALPLGLLIRFLTNDKNTSSAVAAERRFSPFSVGVLVLSILEVARRALTQFGPVQLASEQT